MSFASGVVLVAMAGLVVGSLVDRMIVRLPVGRSFFWPIREHCEACFARLPIGWAIPLVGRFFCAGRCAACGSTLRRRSAFIELLVASLFGSLYWLYFRQGDYPDRAFDIYFPAAEWDHARIRALFVYHSILLALLVAATFIDFDWMIIPDSVTVPGMILGVGLGSIWFVELHPVPVMENLQFKALGLIQPRTVANWFHAEAAPSWAESLRLAWNSHWTNHWNAWSGLVSGLVGLLAGGGVVWSVRAVCSWILRTEAIGFGDVTLMAMVGSFLGWQMVLVAFFLAPISAVVVSLGVWFATGNRAIPYGPHLSIASAGCIYFWKPIWGYIGEVFQNVGIFLFVAVAMLVVLALVTSVIQGVKMVFLRRSRTMA